VEVFHQPVLLFLEGEHGLARFGGVGTMTAEVIRARKRSLRRAMVERILALDPGSRRRAEAALAGRLATLPGYAEAGTVLLYASAFPEEIETRPMLVQTLERGKRLVCPRVDRSSRRLCLHAIGDLENDLTPGTLGIPEPRPGCPEIDPTAVDWALVPGLAFDTHGYRLGRGAGHYDRLLPALRPGTPCWALILDCQWAEDLPVEPHDIPLDGVVSPGRMARREGPRRPQTGRD
jgi:5-formyltetrahydrofolate cyclo-ligase